jgi:hypothetical protein
MAGVSVTMTGCGNHEHAEFSVTNAAQALLTGTCVGYQATVVITNTSGSSVYVGDTSSVAVSGGVGVGGLEIPTGTIIRLDYTNNIYIIAAGNVSVSYRASANDKTPVAFG